MMKKVLIVDDLRSHIDKEKSILDRSEVTIFTATSGSDALAIHRAEKVDLIIVDLDMPDMSGDQLCTTIRRDEALKQVSVLIACRGTEQELERIRRCKANAYVTKPIRPVKFLETVSRFLDVPERKGYRVLMKARVEGKFGNKGFYCSSQNVSASGMLIDSEKILERGDVLSCAFFLPGSECITGDVEVVRVARGTEHPMSYGVRFTNLRSSDRTAIETFVRKRSDKKG